MNLNVKIKCIIISIMYLIACKTPTTQSHIHTEIAKWKGDKKSAISITYDDGIITQFTVAKPIMDSLNLPATFYIITGKIEGAQEGKFIGRDKGEIIRETAFIKTNKDNFFERASLIGFTGTSEGVDYHSRAGSHFESGRMEEAYRLIDEGYEKIRNGTIRDLDAIVFHDNPVDTTTWEDLKAYGRQGHEIASHTVTHPRLAVLDEPNMLYELEQSKADIIKFLGAEYTFTAECPYGTEDERVMAYAHKIYPALRNRMPAPYMYELNRSNRSNPGDSNHEYVQWQRGPLTNIPMDKMKSWVDTCLAHDNIWLVLVFHGVDDYGWEPRTGAELREYFSYISNNEDQLWVATFADVTKYIRQRKQTKVTNEFRGDEIIITLQSNLNPQVYDVPLTLKTYVSDDWNVAFLKTDPNKILSIFQDDHGKYILYDLPAGINKLTLIKK